MSDRYEERIPADLQPVAARLTEQRADIDELQLDEMKQRVLARQHSGGLRRTWIGARLASILTVLALALGTGGALALSGSDSHSNTYGGASAAMYKKHKKHCYPSQGKKDSVGPYGCFDHHGHHHHKKGHGNKGGKHHKNGKHGKKGKHNK